MITRSDIKLVRSLGDKKSREENGLFVVEGHKMVHEAIASGFVIEKLFHTGRFDEYGKSFVERVGLTDMERLSRLKTPADSLALVRIPQWEWRPESLGNELTLALDDLQDPGNLGTIVRIADWFGIRRIIASLATADCFNPKVVQATMGAIFRVEVHYGDLSVWLTEARNAGVDIYGTFLEGENMYDVPLNPCGIIVIGNEGNGIGRQVSSLVTRRLFIPSYPADRRGSESLNAAVAAALACAEFRRRVGPL